MRLGVVASLMGLLVIGSVGCAKGLPTARRPGLGGFDGLVAGPRPQMHAGDGMVAGPHTAMPGLGDGMFDGPRPADYSPGHGLVGGPRLARSFDREVVRYTGPDVITLFDGTPLAGAVAKLDTETLQFADGLVVPRVLVGSVELGAQGRIPSLGAHPLHDVVALHDGEWIEGAVLSANDRRVRLAVYGPDMATRGVQVIPRADVEAIAFRDRRDSPCARAALVFGDGGMPGRMAAEVSNLSLDEVHVFWLADPAAAAPEKLLRCYDRTGASGCQVASWLGQATACPSVVGGLQVHAVRDQVGHVSEARKFYYALRSAERTLATTDTMRRGRRHVERTRPARLNTPYRGEAHYWDTAWRDGQDDGINAVHK